MTIDFNSPTELVCAHLCNLSYERKRDIESTLSASGASLIEYYSDSDLDAQAFTALKDDVLYVAFRGSESVMDWLVNIFYFKDTHHIHGIKTKVHRGFRESLKRINTRIFDDVCCHTGQLVICGHSLGGAMSTIFVTMLPKSVHKRIEHYTYGSPRVGNRKFAREFDKLGLISKRMVNGSDIIRFVPPWFLNFKHVGAKVKVNHDGGPVKDHFIDNYITAIEKGT